MRAWGRRGATVGVALLAACSLTTSLDDLTGGAPDAGGGDGGDGGGVLPADGATEAGAPAWAPCAQRAPDAVTFCDDFDDPLETAGAKWNDTPSPSGGGSVSTTDAALSPPRAFAATVAATGMAEDAFLGHEPSLAGASTAKTLRLSFAMNLDPSSFTSADGATPFDYLELAGFQFDDALCPTIPGDTKERNVHLTVLPNRTVAMSVRGFESDCIDGGNDYVAATTGIAVAQLGGWHVVTLAVTRAASCTSGGSAAAKVELLVDGSRHACEDLVVDPFTKLSSFHFSVGLNGGAIRTTGAATFDDVEMDLR